MKNLLLIALVLCSAFAVAQRNGSIKGTVTDTALNDEPLLFASISLKNTLFKAQTNFHGNFEFTDVAPGDYVLEIAYLGYKTASIPVTVTKGNTTKINQGLAALKLETTDPALSATAKMESTTALNNSSKSIQPNK